jgi:hypothetical protein
MPKHSRPLTTAADRQRVVLNTLGTLRIENLKPSKNLLHKLNNYINGQTTTADLLADARLTYFK